MEKLKRNYPYKIGEILIFLLKRKNISLKAFCAEINVPQVTIARFIKDTNCNPTIKNLLPIARYFKININQLIGDQPLD